MTSQHTHLHLNVEKSLTEEQITADLEAAFTLGADTLGFDELETAWHHSEFARCAAEHGYETYRPVGAAGALGLAVDSKYGHITYSESALAAPGKAGVSPNRYVNRIAVRRTDGQTVLVTEQHAYSSGWTGSKSLDALRQARWYIGQAVVAYVNRRGTKYNDVVIGAGDLNRPPQTFPAGKVLGALVSPKGLRSADYVHTDGTHGSTTFDYLWFLSAKQLVKVASWSTPAFNSDHDGILATLEW